MRMVSIKTIRKNDGEAQRQYNRNSNTESDTEMMVQKGLYRDDGTERVIQRLWYREGDTEMMVQR